MKPKPFSALNHFTVPVAITNFLQERFVDPDSRGRSSRCSSAAPDWNKAHPRHKAASVQDVRFTATTGWRLPQTGRIPPVESSSFEDDLLSPVSYTHLRAHETRHDLVCRLLLEKKKKNKK